MIHFSYLSALKLNLKEIITKNNLIKWQHYKKSEAKDLYWSL